MRKGVHIRREKQPSQAKSGAESGTRRRLNLRRFLTVLVVFAFAVYFVYIMIWQQVTISSKNKEIDALEEKINAANQQTEELQQQLEHLNDPEYLEQVAREKLGLVRPNERVFVDANKNDSNQGN